MALEAWMREVNTLGLVRVADAFCLRVDGQVLCPACGRSVSPRFDTWSCQSCNARGNALMLAALALSEASARNDPDWSEVYAQCAARGLCSPRSPAA